MGFELGPFVEQTALLMAPFLPFQVLGGRKAHSQVGASPGLSWWPSTYSPFAFVVGEVSGVGGAAARA